MNKKETRTLHVVDIVEHCPITGVKYGTREVVLYATQIIIKEPADSEEKKHRHNYHMRAFNTVQQNMLRNRMNQLTKHK